MKNQLIFCIFLIKIDWCYLMSVVNTQVKREIRLLPSNNFEDGSIDPWMDYSRDDVVQWRIEDAHYPTSEVYNPVPKPLNGQRYLRVNRNASHLTSGMAVLHSEIFTLVPGEAARITFSFWIRSRRPQGNNLQLYWMDRNGEEYLLIGLSEYSIQSNYKWIIQSVALPVFNVSTEVMLLFYGYCGWEYEDAVALDDITLESTIPSTEGPRSSSTTPLNNLILPN